MIGSCLQMVCSSGVISVFFAALNPVIKRYIYRGNDFGIISATYLSN